MQKTRQKKMPCHDVDVLKHVYDDTCTLVVIT